MKTISVVIPCHNCAPFLAETLSSVRAQTRQPLEVIVVDDASEDESVAVAEQFEEVKVIRMLRNSGVSCARNTGLYAARGEIVAWLDSDDIWEPEHLATVAGLLEEYPSAGVAFSMTRAFGMFDNVWEAYLPPLQLVDAFWPSWHQTVAQMSTCVHWTTNAMAVGGFEPTIRRVEDFDFFLRLARQYQFICTHQVTALYRKHEASASRQLIASRMQEYTVRSQFAARARRLDPPEFVARLEEEWRRAWDVRLLEAWGDRDLPLLRFYLGLEVLVPGSGDLARQWRRLAKLAPLWDLWDALHGRRPSQRGDGIREGQVPPSVR